jgi:hypothetical protein
MEFCGFEPGRRSRTTPPTPQHSTRLDAVGGKSSATPQPGRRSQGPGRTGNREGKGIGHGPPDDGRCGVCHTGFRSLISGIPAGARQFSVYLFQTTEKRPEEYCWGSCRYEKVGHTPLLFHTDTPIHRFWSLFGRGAPGIAAIGGVRIAAIHRFWSLFSLDPAGGVLQQPDDDSLSNNL